MRQCRTCKGAYDPSKITLKINKQYCSKQCQNDDIYSTDYSPRPMPDLKDGNCVGLGTDVFFPKGQAPPHTRRMCQECPVVQACGEYALHVQVEGMWGGMNDTERAELRKEKGILAEPLTFDYILQMMFKQPEKVDANV